MKIRRGMLRLWIAVSMVWMAVIAVGFSDQLSEIFAMVEPPEGQGAVVLPLGDYACWATRNSANPFTFIVDPFRPEEPKTLTQAWRMCIAHKARIPAIALGPPLALLVLGFVISWIVRGFQRA
jgi:hypothetical protein